MFEHLSSQDYFICFCGITLFWFFRFSSDKDEFDSKEEKFSSILWIKDWFRYKWDNILCHVMTSLFFLYVGEENMQSWIGGLSKHIPTGVDQIGSSAVIGFFGSLIAESLKKLVNLIKT